MAVKFKSEEFSKYRKLADSIEDNLQVEAGVIKEKEPHRSYRDNLPEGITYETIEEISKYNADFNTAAHIAVGEVAAEVFKDKKVDTVEAEVGFFGARDKIAMTVSRDKTYFNYLAGEDDPKEVTKHLVMKTTVTTHSAKGTSLKKVRETMGEEFANMFKS
jgi:hypothetical protein